MKFTISKKCQYFGIPLLFGSDYNSLHNSDAKNFTAKEIPMMIGELISQPTNTIIVVMSNDEETATEFWKDLITENVSNVYIMDGGINKWLDTFATEFEGEFCGQIKTASNVELRYEFSAALGSGCPAAYPEIDHYNDIEFSPKIK